MQMQMQQMAGMTLQELKHTGRDPPNEEPTVEQLLTAPLWNAPKHSARRAILASPMVNLNLPTSPVCRQDCRITLDGPGMSAEVTAEGPEIFIPLLSGMQHI